MVVFSALALTAMSVDRELSRSLVAAGWLGHAAWDFAHYQADEVVSRPYAECCAVLDVFIGASLLLMP